MAKGEMNGEFKGGEAKRVGEKWRVVWGGDVKLTLWRMERVGLRWKRKMCWWLW